MCLPWIKPRSSFATPVEVSWGLSCHHAPQRQKLGLVLEVVTSWWAGVGKSEACHGVFVERWQGCLSGP
ncbi:hypothetical protein CC2G_002062 [Coprinopsis cinerea AmutBmut pab1-1]|nr:hypothetical protein CC2G_002062 [Coprinopsis cinerea AmutBmut pab1-1]